MKHFLIFLLAASGWVGAQNVVYETSFEEFSEGAGEWLNQPKWVGSCTNSVGIDDNIVSGLGKTAFLGFSKPLKKKVAVLRQTPISPQLERIDTISFQTLMGVQDSTNQRRDIFAFSVYNRQGKPLAGVRFDNRETSYGIWRFDGTEMTPTGTSFFRGQLYDLRFTISFADNTWSALFDGLPLFTDQPFHTNGEMLDFIGVAAEWIVTGDTPNDYGDNWLLVGDWKVSTSSPLKDELVLDPATLIAQLKVAELLTHDDDEDSKLPNGVELEVPKLRWQARASGQYFIEISNGLGPTNTWHVASASGWVLAGHRFELQLTIPEGSRRFYRVRRSPTLNLEEMALP